MRRRVTAERLADLRGLGARSAGYLAEVGIHTPDELREVGAIGAYLRLEAGCSTIPTLNFLYALAGAIEDRPWTEVARRDRYELLTALEAERRAAGVFGGVASEEGTA